MRPLLWVWAWWGGTHSGELVKPHEPGTSWSKKHPFDALDSRASVIRGVGTARGWAHPVQWLRLGEVWGTGGGEKQAVGAEVRLRRRSEQEHHRGLSWDAGRPQDHLASGSV